MGRKSKRTQTSMHCEECNSFNYQTRRNKTKHPKMTLNKFCGQCRKKQPHNSKDTKH